MNKAFVRDAEPTVERCPRCGSIGQAVGSATLDAFIRTQDRAQLGETACFCPSDTCPVAYFDAFERLVTVGQLVKPVYPKDPDAPICACFGLSRGEIEQDVRDGVATRTRALVERAKSPEARCAQTAANGQSCVPAVQRYFMKCRQK